MRRVNALDGVPPEQDLCVRAARLLQQETGCKLGVDIELEKRIPMGGGLGGGSSDAATTLLALNRLWKLNLSRERLMQLGLSLGADVPVFVFGENAFAEGVGEQLAALSFAGCVVRGAVPARACAHRTDIHSSRIDTKYDFDDNARPSEGAGFSGGKSET